VHLAAVEAGCSGAQEPLGAALSALAAFLTGGLLWYQKSSTALTCMNP